MASDDDAGVRLVIIGGGGHGREICDVARGFGDKYCIEMSDDGSIDIERIKSLGIAWSGPLSAAIQSGGASYVVGIGDGRIRRRVVNRVPANWIPTSLVDSRAFIGSDVGVGHGVVVFPMVTVATNSNIGSHSHIGRGAAVGHDVSIGDFVSVFPLASISGDVRIGDCATIGSGAVVRQGQVLGDRCFVGAGSVVVSDVPAGVTVIGNPARPVDKRR